MADDDPNFPPETETAALDAVEAFLRRFVAFPSEAAAVATTLWAAHTHAMSAWETTPRIAFLSPEKGSGKTRALEILELLVPRPAMAVNMSPAALFRLIGHQDGLPTILYDESDTVFGPKAREHEEIRGLLNAGYRRGAKTYRATVLDRKVGVEAIEAFGAVALAGLGNLPDTILSRCVIVRMKRRGPAERIEPFRRRLHRAEGEALGQRLAQWMAAREDMLTNSIPRLPAGIEDREADLWEPLIAIADAAGGVWPANARVAAVALVAVAGDDTPSLAVRLLGDIRSAFGEAESMATARLLEALCAIEESPWGDLHGKPLDARRLSRMLRPYEVTPGTIRTTTGTPKGYQRKDFYDPWTRYLPAIPPRAATSATSATSAVFSSSPSEAPASEPALRVGIVADVADGAVARDKRVGALGRRQSSTSPPLGENEGWVDEIPAETQAKVAPQ